MSKEHRARNLLICGTIMAVVQTGILLTATQIRPQADFRQAGIQSAQAAFTQTTLSPKTR
jgi:hypothetical protein